ncbi:MAG: chemotaxis protein CheW [Gammaproteobacteria bacterium]
MSENPNELYSLLVPLHENHLIMPRSCVAEAIRYTAPEQGVDDPEWLQGYVRWHEMPVPVISFEKLAGFESVEPSGRTRIIVLNPTSARLEGGYIAILAQGFPQMVHINADVILYDSEYSPSAGSPVICQVNMMNEQALIPDIEQLEETVERLGVSAN